MDRIREIIKKYPNLWYEQEIEKKSILYKKDSSINKIYFCEKGIVRIYDVNDKGSDITNGFFFENELVIPLISYSKKTSVMLNFHTIEDCIMQVIKIEDWEVIRKQEPIINEILFNKSINILLNFNKYQMESSSSNITERYYNLLKDHPTLKNVKDEYIASYLGVTPVTLSRNK